MCILKNCLNDKFYKRGREKMSNISSIGDTLCFIVEIIQYLNVERLDISTHS